jgi:hypothetical protein
MTCLIDTRAAATTNTEVSKTCEQQEDQLFALVPFALFQQFLGRQSTTAVDRMINKLSQIAVGYHGKQRPTLKPPSQVNHNETTHQI